MSLLKQCPFCGSNNAEYDPEKLCVKCNECAAEGPFGGLAKGNVRQRELSRWNNRRGVTFQAKKGVCMICGCTDDHACKGGCMWVNKQHTLCSACVERSAL